MKKIIFGVFILTTGILLNAQSFTAGNLAVFVTDPSAITSNCNGRIVELNPSVAGPAVNQYLIDGTTLPNALRFSGSATSTCYLALSDDKTMLCFTGGNTTNTASNINTILPRGVGTFNSSGTFNLATTYTGSTGVQTRSATSLNNINWFIGDQNGIYTNGTSSASPSGNIRSVKSFGGTVYTFTASVSQPPVGIISAPSGGTITPLPGLTNGASSRQDFYLISSGMNGSAYDILYILDATAATVGTIFKYSLVSGTWVPNGSYATTFGGFGLAAAVNGGGANLYVSTGTGATSANSVIKLNDLAGYNATININTPSNLILYTTPAGSIIKGVCFAPTCVAASQPANFTAGLSTVNAGLSGVVYTVPNDPTVTYNWSYSGTGATIVGSGNSVTINFSPSATSGTLSVTATNACATSIARTMSITIVPSNDFTSGNLVVLQTIGTVSKASSSITLKEFTTSGTPGITVNIPSTGSNPLQTGGVYGGSEGFLTTSTDQHFLVLGGYKTSAAFSDITATSAATAPRTIGMVAPSAYYTEVSSSTTFYNLNDIRGAISDGTNFWASGASVASVDGIDYYAPGTQTGLGTGATPPKAYGLRIFNGQIYYSTQKAGPTNTVSQLGIFSLGTGMPTSGTPVTAQVINTGTIIPQDFSFNPTDDVCYIAISLNAAAGGIQKWTKTASVWSLAYTLGTGVPNIGAYGLIVDYSGPNPVIYATTFESTGNRIVKITDTGAGSVATNIVAASAGVFYKGITFSPVDGPTPNVQLAVSTNTGTEAGTTAVTVTAYTSSTLSTTQTVSVNISGTGITAGDYNLSNTVITIPAGSSMGSVTFTVVDDLLEEGPETATLTLNTPSSGISLGLVINQNIVIIDNDNSTPTIVMDVATTSNYLDGGMAVSPASPYGLSGVIGDVTDPARTLGIYFTLADAGTPVTSLTLTAVSSNTTVVPNANLVINGTAASRSLTINPVSVGYSNITLTVSDGFSNSTYIIAFAASDSIPAINPNNTFQHTGLSDASDGVALDTNYYMVADDELDVLNVYSRNASGLPFTSYDYSTFLSLPDPANPEVDVEAGTKSPSIINRIFFTGSMSNGKGPAFANKPNRNRIFATTVTGTGAAASVSVVGWCDIKAPLLAWGDANGYAFTASAAAGVDSKAPDGFAAEGMVFGPDNTTLYMGLRAPLVPIANRVNAVIAPIINFETWFNNGAPSGNPTFGSPIELNLGGRGIRDIIRLSDGNYIIVAGNPAASPLTGAIYKWSGHAGDLPIQVTIPATASNFLNMEGAMEVVESGIPSYSKLQVIMDGGSTILYNDAQEAKDFGDLKLRKFRSDVLTGLDINLCSGVTASVSSNDTTTFCAGDSVTLTASSGSSYVWSSGQTTSSIIVSSSGTYSVEVTNASGCTATSSNVIVTVHALPTVSGNVTDNDFCNGTSVTFNGSGATSYTWTGGVIDGIPTSPSSSATYTVTGTDANTCSNTATVSIIVHALPTVGANVTDNDFCNGTSVTFNGTGASSYLWTGGVIDNTPVSPSASATYTVTGTDANACSNTATVSIIVHALPTVGGNVTDNDICTGTSVTFTGTGAISYTWNGGVVDGSPFTPSSTNTYTVTGTDVNTCSNTSTITVTVHTLPTVGGNVTDNDICTGTSVTFTGSGAISYTWTGGVVDGSPFTPSSTNTYTVTGTDANTCTNTSTVTVTVHNLPIVTYSMSADSVCINYAAFTLSGGSPSGGSYSGTGVTGGQFNPGIGTGNYVITYTFTDGNGCTNLDTENILVSGCLYIYNESDQEIMIYPNPTENYFYIKTNTAEVFVLRILDMNGKLAYTGKVSDASMIDASMLAPGTYVVEFSNAMFTYRSRLIKK
jgi:hypothetical protein